MKPLFSRRRFSHAKHEPLTQRVHLKAGSSLGWFSLTQTCMYEVVTSFCHSHKRRTRKRRKILWNSKNSSSKCKTIDSGLCPIHCLNEQIHFVKVIRVSSVASFVREKKNTCTNSSHNDPKLGHLQNVIKYFILCWELNYEQMMNDALQIKLKKWKNFSEQCPTGELIAADTMKLCMKSSLARSSSGLRSVIKNTKHVQHQNNVVRLTYYWLSYSCKDQFDVGWRWATSQL